MFRESALSILTEKDWETWISRGKSPPNTHTHTAHGIVVFHAVGDLETDARRLLSTPSASLPPARV